LSTKFSAAAELKHGAKMFNYRRVKLDKVAARLQALLPAGMVKGGDVVVLDNSLDAHFRDVPGSTGRSDSRSGTIRRGKPRHRSTAAWLSWSRRPTPSSEK